eukprot:GHVS01026235.1.p2 GENE.GHVS01026235.1~~GHVS01026235.1.p2  ORF type:complete len:102 (+),score=1.74 GHVS01026235.1:80-385(+)
MHIRINVHILNSHAHMKRHAHMKIHVRMNRHAQMNRHVHTRFREGDHHMRAHIYIYNGTIKHCQSPNTKYNIIQNHDFKTTTILRHETQAQAIHTQPPSST